MGNFDFFMCQEKKKVHAFKSLCPSTCLNVPQCIIDLFLQSFPVSLRVPSSYPFQPGQLLHVWISLRDDFLRSTKTNFVLDDVFDNILPHFQKFHIYMEECSVELEKIIELYPPWKIKLCMKRKQAERRGVWYFKL